MAPGQTVWRTDRRNPKTDECCIAVGIYMRMPSGRSIDHDSFRLNGSKVAQLPSLVVGHACRYVYTPSPSATRSHPLPRFTHAHDIYMPALSNALNTPSPSSIRLQTSHSPDSGRLAASVPGDCVCGSYSLGSRRLAVFAPSDSDGLRLQHTIHTPAHTRTPAHPLRPADGSRSHHAMHIDVWCADIDTCHNVIAHAR